MLPTARLEMRLVPLETDHVHEQPLGEPVLSNHSFCDRPALSGQLEPTSVALDVAVRLEAVEHLGDRGCRLAEPFGDPRLDDRCPGFRQVVDRLEVFLEGWVVPGRHVSDPTYGRTQKARMLTHKLGKPNL